MAQSYGRKHVKAGDEIVITAMEHHSDIVPWQMLCEEKEATLKVVPINDRGELILEELPKSVSLDEPIANSSRLSLPSMTARSPLLISR